MKLPFFKTKSAVNDQTETQINNLQEEVLKKINLMLPLPSQPIAINYVFLCKNGKEGEHFAAQLAEAGSNVNYCKKGNTGYEITGTTQKIDPEEMLIKDLLLTMIERGIQFNCLLKDLSIETNTLV